MSPFALISSQTDEQVDDFEIVEPVEDLRTCLNKWYRRTVCAFTGGSLVIKEDLTDREFEYVKNNSVMSGTDVSYSLLERFTSKSFEEQLNIILHILGYLAECRLPKEYIGGFMILMVKYHFLPR
jgi:hypothetical protein